MSNVHKDRYQRLLAIMKEKGYGGAALCTSPNLYYLTGYAPKVDERFQILFLSTESEPVLVVPKLYQDEAEKSCWIKKQVTVPDGTDLQPFVADLMKNMEITGALFALDEIMPMNKANPILKNLRSDQVVMAYELFNELRLVKDDEEAELLAECGRRTDEVMQLAFDFCKPGVSEIEVKDYVEEELKKRQVREPFSNLIAFGENASLPHHTSGTRKLQLGDIIYFDIGGSYQKYWSDITRTFYVGDRPDQEFLTAYQAVKEAQEAAVAALKPGMTSEALYLIAYNKLEEYGLGQFFTHRLGHGLGLEGHENMSINRGDTTILKEGMVFTVEPGVYFKGKFGIRIEDTVRVTSDGCQRFNHFNNELMLIK